MMRNFFEGSKSVRVWLAIIFALFISLPFIISLNWLSLVTEMLIMALAACGLNLILGYTGMVNFGPAGIYAVGAYTTALLIVRTGVPFGVAFLAGPVMSAVIGVMVGWFCVRRTHVYFALLTLAFSQLIWAVVFKWRDLTGGDDGIVGIDVPEFLANITSYYYFTLVIVAICLILLWVIVKSPFGKTLQAIRENPGRAEFIGINVRKYQLRVFVLQSFFLGVAGSLFTGFSEAVFSDYAHWIKSTDMIVICLLGGIYNFTGPIVGSVVYISLDKLITSYTEYWLLVLGSIIVFLVLFLRSGIVGFFSEKLSLYFKDEG
jgi:branched-chain amino acid transport system permease protein